MSTPLLCTVRAELHTGFNRRATTNRNGLCSLVLQEWQDDMWLRGTVEVVDVAVDVGGDK